MTDVPLTERLTPMVRRLARKAEIVLMDAPANAPIRQDLMEIRALARLIENTATEPKQEGTL